MSSDRTLLSLYPLGYANLHNKMDGSWNNVPTNSIFGMLVYATRLDKLWWSRGLIVLCSTTTTIALAIENHKSQKGGYLASFWALPSLES